jgi:hypothetical protein
MVKYRRYLFSKKHIVIIDGNSIIEYSVNVKITFEI